MSKIQPPRPPTVLGEIEQAQKACRGKPAPAADRHALQRRLDYVGRSAANLASAANRLRISTNTVVACYGHQPEIFAAALGVLEEDVRAVEDALERFGPWEDQTVPPYLKKIRVRVPLHMMTGDRTCGP